MVREHQLLNLGRQVYHGSRKNTDKVIGLTVGGVKEVRSQLPRKYKQKRGLRQRDQRQLEARSRLRQTEDSLYILIMLWDQNHVTIKLHTIESIGYQHRLL